MTLGFDILGRSHENFPIKMVTNQLKRNKQPFATGDFAWRTFAAGETKKDINQARRRWIEGLMAFCDIPNHTIHRTHAFWHDNKSARPWDDKLVRIPHLKEVAEVLKNFSEEYKRKTFCLSHTAEYYSRNEKAVRKRIDVIRDIAPRLKTVNNPIDGVARGEDIREWHHDVVVPAGQGVSLDGKDAKDVNNLRLWIEKNKNAFYTMLWIHSFNLRENGVQPPPRPDRVIRTTKAEMNWLLSFKR